MRKHQSRHFVPSLHDLILTTALLAVRPCVASLNNVPPSRLHALSSRATPNPEHVILADCRDNQSGSVSSQMAYFPSTPGSVPNDVAVVKTQPGQSALWAGTTTPGLFTDTGTTFTATLGPKVDDGQFAGTGTNGYGNFTCWQQYHANLYTYSGTTCSQVYDCNHSPPPANTTTPVSQPSAGLSVGAVVGIAVGVAGAFLLALAGAFFLFMRRRNRRRRQALSSADGPETNRLQPSPTGSSGKPHGQYPGSASTNSPFGNSDFGGYYAKPAASELGTHNYTFELDTRFQNAVGATEMPVDGARAELHGDPMGMGAAGYGYHTQKPGLQSEQVPLHDPALHKQFYPTTSETAEAPQSNPGPKEHP